MTYLAPSLHRELTTTFLKLKVKRALDMSPLFYLKPLLAQFKIH